jgi:hypothetical protein
MRTWGTWAVVGAAAALAGGVCPAAGAAGGPASLPSAEGKAHVDCSASLHVTTDGPLKVTLSDCPGGASRRISYP